MWFSNPLSEVSVGLFRSVLFLGFGEQLLDEQEEVKDSLRSHTDSLTWQRWSSQSRRSSDSYRCKQGFPPRKAASYTYPLAGAGRAAADS